MYSCISLLTFGSHCGALHVAAGKDEAERVVEGGRRAEQLVVA